MMEHIALARRQLTQAPSRFAGDLDDETAGWLTTLLTQGEPDDWIALARSGAYDAVAALLKNANTQGEAEPDDPLVRAAGFVLMLGFFFPRRDRWTLDLKRARQVLLGEGGFPTLSHQAIPAFYGNTDEYLYAEELGNDEEDEDEASWRWGHIELCTDVMHPLASSFVARQIGLSEAAFRAIVEADAYLDEAGEARLFPWYREEDDEVRPDAVARAERLGVSMPEAFLEEPYEGSWYLARSGLSFLTSWASGTDSLLDLEAASTRIIPLLPVTQRPREVMPGGHAMAGALQHAYEVLCSRNNRLQYYVDDGDAAGITAMLQEAVQLILFSYGVDCGDWSPQSPNAARSASLSGAPEPREYHEEPSPSRAMKLQQLRFVDDESLLLIFPNILAHIALDGEVKGLFPYWGQVTHVCTQGLVLLHHGGELHILDLDSQQWLYDITPDELIAQGRIGDEVFPPSVVSIMEGNPHDNSHHWLSGMYTPDHRYYLEVDAEMIGGIYRCGDRRMMAEAYEIMPPMGGSDYHDEYDEYDEYDEDDEFGESGDYDESDEGIDDLDEQVEPQASASRRASGRAVTLLSASDIPTSEGEAGQRFVIDGVTFALSSGLKPAVDEHEQICFALSNNRWRFCAGTMVTDNGKPLVRFETPVFAGSFDMTGERLLVLTRHHVHLLALDGEPRVLRHISLQSAFDAIQERILGAGGDV